MLADGRHLWNSGIFLFSVRAILEAYRTHAPALAAAVREALAVASADLAFLRLDPAAWGAAPAISIDYAIMEKACNRVVVPFAGPWSDLGAWAAVAREMDAAGVARSGPAHAIDCENTLLRAESPEQVLVGIGLRNIVAVAMHDAVLVADMADGERVREAVEILRARGANQATEFPRFHRPWGWFETLSRGRRFQVKRIMVHPAAGCRCKAICTARVTLGAETRLLGENQSIYIPLGERHRLENPGKVDSSRCSRAPISARTT